MCTIYTFNKQVFTEHKKEIENLITLDNRGNHDGLSLVCIDPSNNSNDLMVKSFNLGWILFAIEDFMTVCGSNGRIWLHQRAATGWNVHLGTMHGFTDRSGNILMHNGILHQPSRLLYAVDSFSLIDTLPTESATLSLMALSKMKETFANVFIIRPMDYTYGVIRCSTGKLYTDGEGNYSTNPVGSIGIIVPDDTAEEFKIGVKEVNTTWDKSWNSNIPQPFSVGDRVRRDIGDSRYDITGVVTAVYDAFTVFVSWDVPFMEMGQEVSESCEDVLDLSLLTQETA